MCEFEPDDGVVDEFLAEGAALVGVLDRFLVADAAEADALDDDAYSLVVEVWKSLSAPRISVIEQPSGLDVLVMMTLKP